MTQAQFTVTTTPVKVFTGPGNVAFRNSGGQTPYIGDSAVTAVDGFPLFSTQPFQAFVADDSEIWAVVASGTNDFRVLSWY